MEKNEKIAGYMKALSHPTRIAIVRTLLKEKNCVNNLKEILKISQPNLSQHLSILRSAGIVIGNQDGQSRCYSLKNPDYLETVIGNFNTEKNDH